MPATDLSLDVSIVVAIPSRNARGRAVRLGPLLQSILANHNYPPVIEKLLAEALVRSHVEALKRRMPHPEAAILGCTHYPLMEKAFREALGPGVAVYSQAGLVAESLEDYLRRRPEFRGSGTRSRFLTTGDPERVTSKATQFLRHPIRFEAA